MTINKNLHVDRRFTNVFYIYLYYVKASNVLSAEHSRIVKKLPSQMKAVSQVTGNTYHLPFHLLMAVVINLHQIGPIITDFHGYTQTLFIEDRVRWGNKVAVRTVLSLNKAGKLKQI